MKENKDDDMENKPKILFKKTQFYDFFLIF